MKQLIQIYNYKQAYEELYDIMNLEYNWNGYGAPAGTAYPYERAVPLLNLLEEKKLSVPYITVTGNRTIQFEWEKQENYLEVELYDDHISVLRAVFNQGNTTFYDRNYGYKEEDEVLEQIRRWDKQLPFLR